MSSIRYQPHIDGLRAVAVLLVILHHLGDWMGTRGGYVGVDVFFVISGFLITSIVKAELEVGSFTFGGFYKRRVIRLAPAYFTVLLATTIAALIWMLPAELLAYVRSMAASSLFLANFHMWREVGGYFGANALATPLLHLWSLAVEEQFYLFWPVVLLGGHRMLGARRMPWVVAVIAIGGAFVSQWGVERYSAAAYYLLPTRVFELAAGALLAYLPVAMDSRRTSLPVSLIGVALILYAAMAYGRGTPFPGYHAVAPVLGAALLLRWGAHGPVGRLLGTPLATGIGKVSYPAYLWHWPIIAFLHINEVAISISIGVAVLVATFVLSWVTHRVLELPARHFLSRPWRRVVAGGAGLPIAASVAVAFGVVALQGLPGRFPESLNRKSEALLAFPNKARGRCNQGPVTSPLPPDDCVLGRTGGEVDFILVGDSHANHFTGFMDELGKAAGMRGYDMTRSNTPYLPGVEMGRPGEPEYQPNFRPRNDYVTDLLKRSRYKVVVLAGAYASFINQGLVTAPRVSGVDAFRSGMREALVQASAAADHVVVLMQVPSLKEGLFDCSLRNERFGYAAECSLPIKEHADYRAAEVGLFRELAREFPAVVWVDVGRLVCDRDICRTEMDGVPLYKDDGHLNNIGARLLAKKWLERYGNPLETTL